MGKRKDLKSILILGAGPIVIGQACEFDYSGVQACRALREEGYRVILVNSNPATIMTDPDMADATYIEPLHWTMLRKIIEIERPDALLPTMGGQTALNCALDLAREGILEAFNVELIGATQQAINKAEDREKFRSIMQDLGLAVPNSGLAHSLEEAISLQARIGFPSIIRPSFTMGGSGGGIAYNMEEFVEICSRGLECSPTRELLIEESLIGWKEYELEVVRDCKDNCIIVCSIENLDPMGVHTGDSITVAPAQTLTDKEYQNMRDAAFKILREIGVDTGGANVQFGINPSNGRMVVIEMNPRVSRSSALASKATGFPIAKIAAKLAVGYTLPELKNDITGGVTPAAFEPVLDYVVTKIPRFNFEKFPQVDSRLTTQMKSVGEVMAIGRSFQESLQKAIRGLEIDFYGLEPIVDIADLANAQEILRQKLSNPESKRLWYIADAFRAGFSVAEIVELTAIDPWFLHQIKELVDLENWVANSGMAGMDEQALRFLKQKGFSDRRLAQLLEMSESGLRKHRHALGVRPVYKRVDTCAAEFQSSTSYLYSCYETQHEVEVLPSSKKIIVLGGGPNRIGQGIEFDYCCVHAALALREDGYETIMINCNPETVSTDYDVSDVLYFEPLTLEDVLEIIEVEKPLGVIVQYGGQTPLKLAKELENAEVKIIGTSPDAIDRAEDRDRFRKILTRLNLRQPANGVAETLEEALQVAREVGYPLLVRPSYVLGGRAMEIVYNQDELVAYFKNTIMPSSARGLGRTILLDRFLDDAIEVDIDAISDGKEVVIGGIMEHIEQAGVHSGDSACCLPPHQLSKELQAELGRQMTCLARELGVIGLVNAQFAVQNGDIYVLEVNPRASRTVPFVSKAIGLPLAKVAARCMLGISLQEQGYTETRIPKYFSVKIPVFPFTKFVGADPLLGPEMKSTGEVMGIGWTPVEAFAKAQLAAGIRIKRRRIALISVRDQDKPKIIELARNLISHGFTLVATVGTARALLDANLNCAAVHKVNEGRPHIVDLIKNGEVDLIVNTTEGKTAIADSYVIRRAALQHHVVYSTTVEGALAISLALKHESVDEVHKLQDLGTN